MVQTTLFDLEKGEAAKDRGISWAALTRADILLTARQIAEELGRQYGEVHADMIMRRLIARKINPAQLGNAAGAIFRGPQWQFTGKWYRSRRVSNHARCIRIWRFKG